MKSFIVIITLILSAFSAFATHGDKQDAVHTVEKLEKLCSAGVSYNKFNDALADAEAEVAIFKTSFDVPDTEYKRILL